MEKEFLETSSYVELDTANYKTYSKTYLKLLLEIGSEVDNVMREMCGIIGRADISNYSRILLQKYPDIINQSVTVTDSNIRSIGFV